MDGLQDTGLRPTSHTDTPLALSLFRCVQNFERGVLEMSDCAQWIATTRGFALSSREFYLLSDVSRVGNEDASLQAEQQ